MAKIDAGQAGKAGQASKAGKTKTVSGRKPARATSSKVAKSAAAGKTKAKPEPARKLTKPVKMVKVKAAKSLKVGGKAAANVGKGGGKTARNASGKAAVPVRTGHPVRVPASGSPGARMLERVRALCAALPETTEVEAWGHPTFRVTDKIFAGFGNHESGASGVVSLGVKTTMDMQAALVSSDPRFTIAKYVGKHGWVSLRLTADAVNWAEIDVLLRGSYRLIAPSKLVQKLDESDG